MRTASPLVAIALAGCGLTTPASGSYSCDAKGNCLDGFLCNAQNLCVIPAAGGTSMGTSTGGGSTSGHSTSVGSAATGTASASGSGQATSSSFGSSSGTSSGSMTQTTASSRTSSSTGSSTGGTTAAQSFAGTWNMDWGTLSLTQNGSNVTGTFQQWGSNQAGAVSGTATGDAFVGSYYWDFQTPGFNPAFLALGDGGTSLAGTWSSTGYPGRYPWCGVRAGGPLWPGCGWSDGFTDQNDDTVQLTQTADEVTGSALNGDAGIAALVSAYRLNGVTLGGGVPTGKVSWWWATPGIADGQGWSEAGFEGNWLSADGTQNSAWCGARQSQPAALPAICFGGGGLYDGTWFTNLGPLAVIQAVGSSQTTGGTSWSFWGSPPGAFFAIPDSTTLIDANGLGWDNDGSALQGAVGLVAQFSDGGLVLTGQTVTGALWCGAQYQPDPYNGQDPLGTLPPGCGLTNQWSLWGPPPSPTSATLTQERGEVIGGGTISGLVVGTDAGTSVQVTGAAGGFELNWFPDAQDQTFAGDDGADGGWCGSTLGVEPSPCFE